METPPSTIEVSGWKNGKFDNRKPVAIGISVGRKNAERFFDKRWDVVVIQMDGITIPVRITNGFRSKCPELRHPAIADWMKRKGLVPWARGNPPKMFLTHVFGNKFRLSS